VNPSLSAMNGSRKKARLPVPTVLERRGRGFLCFDSSGGLSANTHWTRYSRCGMSRAASCVSESFRYSNTNETALEYQAYWSDGGIPRLLHTGRAWPAAPLMTGVRMKYY